MSSTRIGERLNRKMSSTIIGKRSNQKLSRTKRSVERSNRKMSIPREMSRHWFPSPFGLLSVTIKTKKRLMQEPFSDSSDDSSDDSSETSPRESEESPPKSKKKKPLSLDSSILDSSNFGIPLNPSTDVMKGGHLDVVSFLSNNGKTTQLVRSNGETVGIDVVRDKHVLICCLQLPVPLYSRAYSVCRSLIDAYSELRRDLFEIVLVADMAPCFHLHKEVFNHFFSAFKCLAVPFSDSDTRHFICSSIGFDSSIGAILVGPKGDILQHHDAAKHFRSYGSGWYPFTDATVKKLETHDDILRIRLDPLYQKRFRVSPRAAARMRLSPPDPPSLVADILLCDEYFVLKRVDPDAGPSMEVSKLSEKHIGLYLCYDGDFMETLNEVHKKCLAMKQELEIVLVSLPLSDDPVTYKQNLCEALKLFNITSWFLFPFEGNRRVCRRLYRLFGQHVEYDKLVILPPCNSRQPGEIEARAIIDQFGIDVYPFTASQIIEQRYNALRSLNPVSWFIDIDSYVWKSKLDGKKLLLYLDRLQFDVDNGDFCLELMEHYPEIKALGYEVVFIPVVDNYVEEHALIAKMPWPMMLVQDAIDASVTSKLVLQGDDIERCRIIVLGEDGKIRSKRGHLKLMEEGVTESLFADTLRQELVQDFTCLKPHVYFKW